MSTRFLRLLASGALLTLLAVTGSGAPNSGTGGFVLHLTASPPTFEPIDGGRLVVPRIPGSARLVAPGSRWSRFRSA